MTKIIKSNANFDGSDNENDPFQREWRKTFETENRLPTPGRYVAKLFSATQCEGKWNGTPQVEVVYALEPNGTQLKSFFALNSQGGRWHLRVWLERLGYCLPAHHRFLQQLLNHITEDGARCLVQCVASSGGYIYGVLLRRLDPLPEPPEDEEIYGGLGLISDDDCF